jgi:hypothetical protein
MHLCLWCQKVANFPAFVAELSKAVMAARIPILALARGSCGGRMRRAKVFDICGLFGTSAGVAHTPPSVLSVRIRTGPEQPLPKVQRGVQ